MELLNGGKRNGFDQSITLIRRHILQYVTGWVVRGSENLNFGKQSFRRFGILLTIPAGMSEPHSLATRTAVEYAVGVGRFMLRWKNDAE